MQTTNDSKRQGRSVIGGAAMTNKLMSAVLATQVASNDSAQDSGVPLRSSTSIETLPVPEGVHWFAKAISDDYKAGAAIWREVTIKDFDYALDVLPPLNLGSGFFLLGEPYDHTDDDVVYCAMVRVSGRYYSRYVPRKQFAAMRAELVAHLTAVAEAGEQE